MTAPGRRPRQRQEEWDFGGWEYAAPQDPGHHLRERLLQRMVNERRLRRQQDASKGRAVRTSMADLARADAARRKGDEVDLRSVVGAEAVVAEADIDLSEAKPLTHG